METILSYLLAAGIVVYLAAAAITLIVIDF